MYKNSGPRRHHRIGMRNGARRLPQVRETSAGGLIIKVEKQQAYVALIARRNRAGDLEWCLPKGHIEKGETAAQAAKREIFEETGIEGRVLAPLTSIDYWFVGPGKLVHKVVHHFLLEATGGNITVENDPDGEAESAAWVALSELENYLIYPNEQKVVRKARKLLYID